MRAHGGAAGVGDPFLRFAPRKRGLWETGWPDGCLIADQLPMDVRGSTWSVWTAAFASDKTTGNLPSRHVRQETMAFGLLVFADKPSDDGGGVSHKPHFRGKNREISSRGPRVPMRGTEIRERAGPRGPDAERPGTRYGRHGRHFPAGCSLRVTYLVPVCERSPTG